MGFLCILIGVALDEAPRTHKKIRDWASYLISNPSLSSLILTGLQKNPTSFDSFEKDLSLRLRPRWNNAGGSKIIRTHYSKKRLIASNFPSSSEKWISIAHKVIIPLGNHPTHTTVAIFQALAIRDPREKSAKPSPMQCSSLLADQTPAEAAVIGFFWV